MDVRFTGLSGFHAGHHLGGVFQLVYGKRFSDLVLYWFVGLIGFFVGQGLADVAGLRLLLLGQVHVLEATLGCAAAMFVARWLKA